jgi:hypothetical protein
MLAEASRYINLAWLPPAIFSLAAQATISCGLLPHKHNRLMKVAKRKLPVVANGRDGVMDAAPRQPERRLG